MDPTPDRLDPDLNTLPRRPRHIHLMGICGTGMASLAGMLKEKGFFITGSDQNVYPPMSTFLDHMSIQVFEGYHAQNLDPTPDLIIVGNVITRENPEAVQLARLKIPYLSFPQALRAFAMKGKKSIVISGTHGKTTTSGLCSWLLDHSGLEPGFMVGGIVRNFSKNFQLGTGAYFVIEGDEYDTAFFDKGPKFLHYAPWITILTSIEFDHADIYRDLDHVIENFRKLIRIIPHDGLLIANGDDPIVREESLSAPCPVVFYGFGAENDWRADRIRVRGDLCRLDILGKGLRRRSLETPLYGRHNIANLLSIIALSHHLQIDEDRVADAARHFKGIKRRQEVKGEKQGIMVIDDFAHHPTAVRETIKAVKNRYGRRLIAVFEPRSNSSRRNIFQENYANSFNDADIIFIPEPALMEKIPPEDRFSSQRLVQDLNTRGLKAHYSPDTSQLLGWLIKQSRKGDVILIMSNGAFDNLPAKLLERLGPT